MGQVIAMTGSASTAKPAPKVRAPYVLQDDDDHRITMTIWRRHRADCKERKLGRDSLKCTCPLWGDGCVDSVRVLRQSLATGNMRIARRRLAGLLEDYLESLNEDSKPSETNSNTNQVQQPEVAAADVLGTDPVPDDSMDMTLIGNAAKAFLANCETNGVGADAIRKYRNTLKKLTEFAEIDEICGKRKVQKVADLKVTDLDRFRAGRKLAQITSLKELERLRTFWGFCAARELCPANIAAKIKGPIIVDQNDVTPYTAEEIGAIVNACSTFGQYDYERKRALAIALTLRYTALRVSDVALLRRDRISRKENGWRIFIRTTKNNAAVYLLIPQVLVDALNDVPPPRKSGKTCEWVFWNGASKPKSQISEVSETLAGVFRKSGVHHAGAHRFRHTLATELVENGASFEEVADVLGNSPEIVRKHYAKWSEKRQRRIDELIQTVHREAWKGDSTKH